MATGERVEVVDFLRGAALFGILAVNVWFFVPEQAGGAARDLTNALFATKAYLLFAFLFGYSFGLQRRKAAKAGRAFGPLMRRRHTGLLVLGLLNGLLLFEGDILLPYALLGFLLYRMRDLPSRSALRRAVVLTVATAGVLGGLGLLVWLADESGGSMPSDQAVAVAASHAAAYLPTLAWVLTIQAAPAFAAMLVGMAAERASLLTRRDLQQQVWHRIAPAGPIVGAVGAVALALGLASGRAGVELTVFGVTTLTAPFLTATYAALLIRLHRRWPHAPLITGVSAAGRFSLTNYLAQSIALNLVFISYRGPVLLAVIAIYAGQVLLSAWWAGSHRYGPAEWVLRRWTYR